MRLSSYQLLINITMESYGGINNFEIHLVSTLCICAIVYNRQRPQAKGHAANADYTPWQLSHSLSFRPVGWHLAGRHISGIAKAAIFVQHNQQGAESFVTI